MCSAQKRVVVACGQSKYPAPIKRTAEPHYAREALKSVLAFICMTIDCLAGSVLELGLLPNRLPSATLIRFEAMTQLD